MGNRDKTALVTQTKEHVAILTDGMPRIANRHRERVAEGGGCFFERDAVASHIARRFVGIPFKVHRRARSAANVGSLTGSRNTKAYRVNPTRVTSRVVATAMANTRRASQVRGKFRIATVARDSQSCEPGLAHFAGLSYFVVMSPQSGRAAQKLWQPHPDDEVEVHGALASVDRGEVLSVEASEAFLRWLEGSDDESWRAECE